MKKTKINVRIVLLSLALCIMLTAVSAFCLTACKEKTPDEPKTTEAPAQSGDACAMAIANQLGLVCDPVAGLVEIPCIKRNVSGLMIAFSCADMALADISARIPVDECIDAMREVGNTMPASLRETAGGGLAATPTGKLLKEKVFGK